MKTKTKIILLAVCLIFLETNRVLPQALPDSIVNKINKLFAKWDKADSPGCVVGIVRNDSLIFAKGYGMANLEYDIPIKPQTIFHMASVSKQFTAYSILMLAKSGKLNLDDDIRKYLTWFPDMKKKITIRHLLNHTSGIRDQWQLLNIAGTRMQDVITQEHIIKILGKQKELNFEPGEQFLYSNSGFTLLAEIVKSVSGLSLRKFADSTIFKPLRMNNTHFHDDCAEIEKYRSYSYDRIDSVHFANSILSYANVGATSLFTNVYDMSKWIMNFYNPKAGDQNDIIQFTQKAKLNNGTEIPYALGIVPNTYKGWIQYSHSGADAGYTTFISAFPELKMGFIVFGNVSELASWNKATQMYDFFIKDKTKQPGLVNQAKRDSAAANIKDLSSVKKYLGNYISDSGTKLSLDIKNSKLTYRINTESDLLVYESKDIFSRFNTPNVKIQFSINSKDTVLTVVRPSGNILFKKYIKDILLNDNMLLAYTGEYYSPELECKYGIILKDHQLYLTNNKYDDELLTLAGVDNLFNGHRCINHLTIMRDNSNQITGFEVSCDRVMHLKFNKIK